MHYLFKVIILDDDDDVLKVKTRLYKKKKFTVSQLLNKHSRWLYVHGKAITDVTYKAVNLVSNDITIGVRTGVAYMLNFGLWEPLNEEYI